MILKLDANDIDFMRAVMVARKNTITGDAETVKAVKERIDAILVKIEDQMYQVTVQTVLADVHKKLNKED